MLIDKTKTDNGILEFHHLGRLRLGLQVSNPEPKGYISDDYQQPMIGTVCTDGYLRAFVESDFYYTYEKTRDMSTVEKVSFLKPVKMLHRGWGRTSRYVLLAGLVPFQHPAVTRYDYDFEPAGFNIPSGNEDFYGWEYVKTSSIKRVDREVRNRDFGFLIESEDEKDVKRFIPYNLFEPLYKSAPLYVLDVLDMLDFEIFEGVPPGYHEFFIPRLSQKLLTE